MFFLTKLALKRPVSVILTLITILFFGIQSVLSSKMELMPEMNLPMIIVSTTYIGAAPKDVDKLVTKNIEEGLSSLSSVKVMQSLSRENFAGTYIQYEYGTNMDKAYMDLKKAIDAIRPSLPEDVKEPLIMQIDINSSEDMYLSISSDVSDNIYGYVEKSIVPEFEKLESVSSVSVSGGEENYIKIELKEDKLSQYKLDIQKVSTLIMSSNFTIPAGTLDYGRQKVNLSISSDTKDIEKIKNIVLPLATGEVVRLSDIADVYYTKAGRSSISRYNGADVIGLSISRQKTSSAVDLSKDVKFVIKKILAENENLHIEISNDNADNILGALGSVYKTLILAVILSMIVLYLFFGDIKASLIVGSSIPVSVMLALAMMGAAGFSLNMISLGALVVGVGMIVDASIVVLDSLFREKKDRSFEEAALEGTRLVIASIFGSTLTTCVVFLPLALLKGLSGQLFSQLGYTIVFCMIASFLSAITIVPLLFKFAKPVEKDKSLVSAILLFLQDKYRKIVTYVLPKKVFMILTSIILLIISFFMATAVGVELMPSTDIGAVDITAKLAPGLKIEEVDRLAKQIEDIILTEEELDKYTINYSSGGNSFSFASEKSLNVGVYLKKDRKQSTDDVVKKFKNKFKDFSDASITVENINGTGSGFGSSSIILPFESTDYDLLKANVDRLVLGLQKEEFLTNIHSDSENTAPLMSIDIDELKAGAYGLNSISVANTISSYVKGMEVMRYTKDGSDISVRLEFAEGNYSDINDVENIMIDTPYQTKVAVSDIANVSFKDNVNAIVRNNRKYQVSINAMAAVGYESSVYSLLEKYINENPLDEGVVKATNTEDRTTMEELINLLKALLTAIFLIFIVMAMQFESPKFSFMVMFTIPFSLIGAFSLLFFTGVKISMPSMLGFLMMVGTVVNNGILYVDTANMLREDMNVKEALVEAGVIRLRPILMTTLTTILAMLPMALAFGDSGEALQGLALVNVGGLLASTILSLLLIPTLYLMIDKKKKVDL